MQESGDRQAACKAVLSCGDTVERGFKIPEQGLGFRQEKNSDFQALISF
jgi:hypothetical protein